MSVLRAKRKESAAEYVNVACKIYEHTLNFMARLSNRYQRLLAADTMRLASEVMDNAEKANNIMITSDETTYSSRKAHLLEARASVMALDVHMSYVWNALMSNPQGCFTNTKGETVPPSKAEEILNKMADELGCEIDEFKNKVTNLLQSDHDRFKKLSQSNK